MPYLRGNLRDPSFLQSFGDQDHLPGIPVYNVLIQIAYTIYALFLSPLFTHKLSDKDFLVFDELMNGIRMRCGRDHHDNSALIPVQREVPEQ